MNLNPTLTTKVCLDVQYSHDRASVASVEFRDWEDAQPSRESTLSLDIPSGYDPGSFYKRELPCLLEILATLETEPDTVLIDGYVAFGPDKPALGRYLYEELGLRATVIGVAKSEFKTAEWGIEVFRGESTRPLLVTAIGMPTSEAADHIASMHGEFRIPTLLKRVDRLARHCADTHRSS